MTKDDFNEMTIKQLIDRFIEICLAEYEAIEAEQFTRHNRLFAKMTSIENELKSRPGDARTALIPLLQHPHIHVQLMAAEATPAVALEASRQTLQTIKQMRWHPHQAMEAGSFIRGIDSGEYKPK
jgi:hypothetical protein